MAKVRVVFGVIVYFPPADGWEVERADVFKFRKQPAIELITQ